MDSLRTVPSPIASVCGALLLSYLILRFLSGKWSTYRFARLNKCEPPPCLPSNDPLLGLDLIYQNITLAKKHKVLETTLSRFSTYGRTFRTQRLTTPSFVTCEPENIQTILSRRFKDYSMGERTITFAPLLGHGIFNTDGDAWAHSRHMLRPNFVKQQVADLPAFERLMDDLLALIPTNGDTVDLQDLFFDYTIDSATEFLFGHSINTLKKRREDGVIDEFDFATSFNYAQSNILTNVRLGPLRMLNVNRKAVKCNQVCHQMVEQFVDKALMVREGSVKEDTEAGVTQRYFFLNGLAQQTGDRERIRDEVMNVLLAGRDTTASLLGNMFFMLAKCSRVWSKLREEVASLGGVPPTYDQLRNLKYLRYCLNESLRLHPVVPLNSRFAAVDTILPVGGGSDGKSPIHVPKGAIVSYSVFAMHRREDLFGPDANEYRPERWADLRPTWEYLPFNGGPRICIGQQYALTEAAYVTTRLAQQFSILESRDPGVWEEGLTLTLCSGNGTKVCLRK